MALKGEKLWDELEGVKDELKEVVEISFGGVVGEVTVVFRDLDEIQEVFDEYRNNLPPKPTIEVEIDGKPQKIEVPNENETYKAFNEHPKAKPKIKKWQEKCKPFEKDRIYRSAYLFIAEDERPSEDIEEGIEILKDCLPYVDAVKITNKGMSFNNMGERLGKQEEGSLQMTIPQED